MAPSEHRHAVPAAGRAAQRGGECQCRAAGRYGAQEVAFGAGRGGLAVAGRLHLLETLFGVDGIDLEHGITTSTLDEAKLTRKMMKASSQNIVLADSSKFGQRGFGRICALEDIDVIITDDGIPEQMVTIVEEAGVDLIIVR